MGEGTALDGDKSHEGAYARGDDNQGPLDKVGEGETVDNQTDTGATSQLEKLLESHVADEAEFIAGDVLGNGVLVHRTDFMLLREAGFAN